MISLTEPIPWTDEEIEGPVPLRFERIAALLPDQPAVRFKDSCLTYDQLNRRANGLASCISAWDPKPEAPVGILMGHRPEAVAAILGVLKAGRIYSVLDPNLPEERLEYLVDDLGAGLLLTDAKNAALAGRLADDRIPVEPVEEAANREGAANPPIRRGGMDLAAVFYTSGSTGKPKGVARRHGTVTTGSYMDFLLRKTVPGERQSSLFGYGFGASVSDLFGALLTGSVLCPYDFKQEGTVGLSLWMESERISILHIPVSLLRQWMGGLAGKNRFPDLRILHLGGNAVTRQDVLRSRTLLAPGLSIEHRMSTTETSNITRYYVDADTELPEHTLPAGHPVEEKEILILGPDGSPLIPGETGEIAVRSRLLPDGYWRRPDLSRDVFIPDPEGGPDPVYRTGDLGRLSPDGGLEHLGRLDHQIKIRGYRIELSEIEAVLLEHPGIAEAVVVPEPRPDSEPRLIAYLSYDTAGPDLPALRAHLGSRLPEYMIPNIFVPVDHFPLTTTGKVNRRALPEPPRTRPRVSAEYRQPGTALETAVAALWEEVLGLEGLGVDDPFHELGGDSLSAARILQRAASAGLGQAALGDFYSDPTIAGTAALLVQTNPAANSDRSLERALSQLEDF